MEYVLYFQGREAVKAGYAYQSGKCYRPIMNDGEYCGQLEVVRDDEEAQLVAVSYIPENQLDYVMRELEQNGFAGMEFVKCVEEESMPVSGGMTEDQMREYVCWSAAEFPREYARTVQLVGSPETLDPSGLLAFIDTFDNVYTHVI